VLLETHGNLGLLLPLWAPVNPVPREVLLVRDLQEAQVALAYRQVVPVVPVLPVVVVPVVPVLPVVVVPVIPVLPVVPAVFEDGLHNRKSCQTAPI
jgi:hypothetical protein